MNLKNYLKINKEVRRLFGKRETEIIIKQLEGQKLTQSERNRLSRDIKPKFNCIAELHNYRGEFTIEKNQENKYLIEQTVTVILQDDLQDDVQAILLFGSFADNTSTTRSDIDIAVVFQKPISNKEATMFRIRVMAQLNEKIDLQVFNVLPQKIKQDIARNHKVLYKTKNYDNTNFSIQYLKDDDYSIRIKHMGMET